MSEQEDRISPIPRTTHERTARGSFAIYAGGIVLVGFAAFAAFAMSKQRHSAIDREADSRQQALAEGPRVVVAEATVSNAARKLTLPGDVRAFAQATLYAKVSGYLKTIRVDRGDHVKKDQVLGVIESPETDQQVIAAKADLAIKKTTVDRYKPLAERGVVSQQELDTALANLGIAEANLSRVLALRDYETIRAPFDGTVTARYADPGALLPAATGSTGSALPLVDVQDVDRVRIFFYPGQGDAPFVHEKDEVEVWTDARPNDRVKGTVTRVAGALDPKTRTLQCEIDLPNKDRIFLPGTFAHVALQLKRPQYPRIPSDALVPRRDETLVAVVKDRKVHFVDVRTGEQDGRTVEIVDGLSGGEQVAIGVGLDVGEGDTVQPVKRQEAKRGGSPGASGSAASGASAGVAPSASAPR